MNSQETSGASTADFLKPLDEERVDLSRDAAFTMDSANFGAAALRAEYSYVAASLNQAALTVELANRQREGRTVDDPFRPMPLLEGAAWLYGAQAELDASSREYELDELRDYLTGLDDLAVQYLNRYMNYTAVNFIGKVRIAALKSRRQVSEDWRDWLANEATDDELMNMVEWHLHTLAEQALDPDIKTAIDDETHQFEAGIWYLEEARLLGTAPKNMSEVTIRVGDTFSTLLRGWSGYYAFHSQVIALGQASGPTPEVRKTIFLQTLPAVLTHELVHALIDKSRELPNDTFNARWIEEAMTETIAYLLRQHANPLAQDTRVYTEERRLLNLLMRKESDSEHMKQLAIRGFTGDATAAQQFSDALDHAWDTPDVLQKINTKIKAMERTYPDGLAPSVREKDAVNDLLRALEYHDAIQAQASNAIDIVTAPIPALPLRRRTKKK